MRQKGCLYLWLINDGKEKKIKKVTSNQNSLLNIENNPGLWPKKFDKNIENKKSKGVKIHA